MWTCVLFPLVFGLIAMGIGTVPALERPGDRGLAALRFAATPLLALVEAWNETVGDLMLLQALDRLTGAETSLPVAVAGLAAAAWVTLFWALGGARLARDEY